ncbi:MAG: MurR/RpiR family transcriptional regulator [Pseudomonadota bacterium]
MIDMNVPFSSEATSVEALQTLSGAMPDLTPEIRKAAAYVLENPNDVGVSSVREIADAAGVKPNTVVRMARIAGFEGYDDFRAPFREEIRRGNASYPDRARWLQSLGQSGELGGLYADMASSAISAVEQTFAATDADKLKAAADAIVASRKTYILGLGVNHTLAQNFAYLASLAMERVYAVPSPGGTARSDLAHGSTDDVLIAMTFKPYRSEVLDAVEAAKDLGMTVIGISDSPASPLVAGSQYGFAVATDTPLFFPSTVGALALLEALMAFVIADAKPHIIAAITDTHAQRKALGVYQEDWRDSWPPENGSDNEANDGPEDGDAT